MRCMCGKKAVYYRKNEGNFYCGPCFSSQLERKVKKFVRQNALVEKNDCIAIALSGGKDSSTVLHLLMKIFKDRKDLKIFAITIDEGISGYRDKSIDKAKKFAESLGVEHYVVGFKQVFGLNLDEILRKASKNHVNACTYCGVLRRYLLNKAARELGATKLCTGHNLDDEAQAILINCLKGDTERLIRTVSRAKPCSKFVARMKPLRWIPEKEIALYSLLNRIKNYWGECPYASGIRFEVRDFLNMLESRHAGTKFGLVSAFNTLLKQNQTNKSAWYVSVCRPSAVGTEKILFCENCGEPSSMKICKACELISTIKK